MNVQRVEKLHPGEVRYPTAGDFSVQGDTRHPDDKLPSEKPTREVTAKESVGWARRLMPGLFRG